MALRAEKMAERRERILASAREIIAEGGFEALTTRALARRARVTVPTIYNLVGAKDAVLFAAVEEQTARFLGALGESEDLSPPARALAVSADCAEELLRAPRYYRALLRLLFSSTAAVDSRRSVGRTVVSQYRRALEALDASGQLADWAVPAEIAGRLGVHLTAVALQWATDDLSDEEFRRTAALGTCLVLLGVAEGEARSLLVDAARGSQRRAKGARTARSAGER